MENSGFLIVISDDDVSHSYRKCYGDVPDHICFISIKKTVPASTSTDGDASGMFSKVEHISKFFISAGHVGDFTLGCQNWDFIPRSWKFLEVMGFFLRLIFSKKPWDKSWEL